MSQSTTLIIFGATGDLVSKKIIPSIYNLFKSNSLPEKFRVIAFARRDFNDGKYNEVIKRSLESYGGIDSSEDLSNFYNIFSYHQGDFNNFDSYQSLKEKILAIDKEIGDCSDKIFYLAVPPEYFKDLFNHLFESKITMDCVKEGEMAKILVEKPFGKDLKTAEELEEILCKIFDDRQIYRIDHYLAKWVVDNIVAFRSTNILFEPIWNNKYIEKIEITTLESLGVENRGGFYDPIGALRDVGQNHLLEILALLTMELPGKEMNDIRMKRGEALEMLKVLSEDEIKKNTKRAQYKGYQEIKDVRMDSNTETYFKVNFFLEGERWEEVPISIEAGKKFAKSKKEIIVTFKKIENFNANKITFSIEPEENIEIDFNTRLPGKYEVINQKTIARLNTNGQSKQYVEEYTQLLLDAIKGEQKNFVTATEVKAMWKFIDPIIEAWEKNIVPLETYEPGIDSIN